MGLPNEYAMRGVPEVAALLQDYSQTFRKRQLPDPACPPLDEEWMMHCADVFDASSHEPTDPITMAAYAAFKLETAEQLAWVERHGFKFILQCDYSEPYGNSAAMRMELREHKTLRVCRACEIGRDHPLSKPLPNRPGWTPLFVFRAVHDVVHAAYGFEFGPRGEEATVLAHAELYSREAFPALIAETRMQSSKVFFGKHLRANGRVPKKGEAGFIAFRDRPFPAQKAFVPDPDCLHYQL